MGYLTFLYFCGDPDLPGEEAREGDRLQLRRWCQWISAYHRGGVYDGDDPDGFMPRDDIVSYLERYAASFDAPVREGVAVTSLRRANGSPERRSSAATSSKRSFCRGTRNSRRLG